MRWALPIASAVLAACGGTPPRSESCSPACGSDQVCRYDTCIAPPVACPVGASCPGDQYCDTSAMECVPWGLGPGGASDAHCEVAAAPGVFFPRLQCEWSGPPADDAFPDHVNVLATPMVASFAGAPSIVFTAYNGSDHFTPACSTSEPGQFGVIRVIDGRTCAQQATIAAPHLIGSAALAIADLGGADATPEIVAARKDGGLVAFTRVAGAWQELWRTTSAPDTPCNWAGPSIHDLDDDGVPEVIFYGAVYDGRTGEVIDPATSIVGSIDFTGLGYIPVVADVDGDGVPELVTGSELYSWDRTARKWMAKRGLPAANGRVAVGDFGTFPASGQGDRSRIDGIAETVVILKGVVHVFTTTGQEVFTAKFPVDTGQGGGPPILADFDGDGRLEIGAAGPSYTVFDPDCHPAPDPATCASMSTNGVLWSRPSLGNAADVAASSAFDFDGDGRAEVVHGDRCFTRVYDGRTGAVEYSRARTSCLWYENPVVADTDGDRLAELVTTSNANGDSPTPGVTCGSICPAIDPIFDGVACIDDADCPSQGANPLVCRRDRPDDAAGRCRCQSDADCGDGFACGDPAGAASPAGKVCLAAHDAPAHHGVQVLADTVDRWASARSIWNQHAYSVTNVDDAGKVPRTSGWLRNWTQAGLNNFRQGAPGDAARSRARADLTIRQATASCESSAPTVSAEVCNRGSLTVGAGVAVTVYAQTTPTRVRCQAATSEPLAPGSCATVSCAWQGAPGDGAVSVDDRGAGLGAIRECREDNNVLPVRVSCP